MKIEVDDKGWAVVGSSSDGEGGPAASTREKERTSSSLPSEETPGLKPSSGVYPRTAASDEIGQAPTEPSPPTEEAIMQGEMALPPPATIPPDLAALAGAKVA